VTRLEQELAGLAPAVFPETPELSAAVLARLSEAPAPSRWAPRRRVVVAVAIAVAVAIGAVLAVPPARSTVLRWFGIGGVTVQVVDRLPSVPVGGVLQIGVRVPLADAQQRVPFHIHRFQHSAIRAREGVYVGHFAVDEVTLLYGNPRSPNLLLTEASGRLNVQFAGKLAGPGTRIEQLSVDGRPALWIEAAPHAFFFVGPKGVTVMGTLRLARNTLIWQRDGVVLRLEGQITRAQALRLASQLR
jgi:hypothetical protein